TGIGVPGTGAPGSGAPGTDKRRSARSAASLARRGIAWQRRLSARRTALRRAAPATDATALATEWWPAALGGSRGAAFSRPGRAEPSCAAAKRYADAPQ